MDNTARGTTGGGDVIAFDAATFDRLIAFMTECKKELDDAFLSPRNLVPLRGADLRAYLKPGSPDWPVVQAVFAAAEKFGESAFTKLEALSKEWGRYIHALIDAKAVFEKSNNLATMSASEFLNRFPGLAPSTMLPPGGAIV